MVVLLYFYPGSIFLIGTFAIAFNLDNWTAFGVNLIPITIYIVVCLVCKPDTQIMLAQLLSIMYALVMMAVLVGMIIQFIEDGWLAPTTLMFLFVTSVFVLAAFLHPQEFW